MKTMETNYERASRKVSFLAQLYRSLLYILVFNLSYMAFNLVKNGKWFNHVSVAFLIFSVGLLTYRFVKYLAASGLIKAFKDLNFGRKQNLFVVHISIFVSFLTLKVLTDLNNIKLFEIQEETYLDYLCWFGILTLHFLFAFGSEFSFVKNWEQRKIQEILNKK